MADESLARYAAAYSWAKSDPELATIFNDYETNPANWTEAKFEAAIKSTNWWRTKQESNRQYTALKEADPAQARAMFDAKYEELHRLADQLGVAVTHEWLVDWADMALRYDWSPDKQRDIIADRWQMWQFADTGGTPGQRAVPTGEASTAMAQLNALASDYAVPISDTTKQDWMRQILSGVVNVDEFRGYLASMAKSRYAGLADALDRGLTVKQIADPYVQIASQELEIAPEEINLADPKWQRFLEHRDPKSGALGQMTLAEWISTIRNDAEYGWDRTLNARKTAAQFATKLAETFGVIG